MKLLDILHQKNKCRHLYRNEWKCHELIDKPNWCVGWNANGTVFNKVLYIYEKFN